MLNKTWIIAAVAAVTLAGCLETDLQRSVTSAPVGVATGDGLGVKPLATDPAGFVCDDAGLCRQAQ